RLTKDHGLEHMQHITAERIQTGHGPESILENSHRLGGGAAGDHRERLDAHVQLPFERLDPRAVAGAHRLGVDAGGALVAVVAVDAPVWAVDEPLPRSALGFQKRATMLTAHGVRFHATPIARPGFFTSLIRPAI